MGTNITIKVLCDVMGDASLGDPYTRYVAVARLMMDTYSVKCLDVSFSNYVRDMTNTSWDGPAAGGGGCICSVSCRFVAFHKYSYLLNLSTLFHIKTTNFDVFYLNFMLNKHKVGLN